MDHNLGRGHRRTIPQWLVQAAGVLGFVIKASGWVAFVASVFAPHMGARLLEANSGLEWIANIFASAGVGIAIAVVLHAVGANLLGWSLRKRAGNAAEVLAADPRAPVLYLRPFQEDLEQARAARQASFVPEPTLRFTAETAVHQALAELGPLVAIGRPGESLPPRGFARLYLEGDNWQGPVSELLRRATVIVLVAGTSPGVAWEVEQSLRSGDLSRLVYIIPAWKSFDYETFRRMLESKSGIQIPPLGPAHWKFWPLDIRALLSFDGMSARLHEFGPPAPLPKEMDSLKRAVLRWYQRRGIPAYPPMEVQAQGLLLEALRPRLAHLGTQVADPRLPYLNLPPPSPLVTLGRRLSVALLVVVLLFVFVVGPIVLLIWS
jgi:hypothetical protein